MESLLIEVFKTDIKRHAKAGQVIQLLTDRFPGCRISIDLEDCDKVLRIEGYNFLPCHIIELLQARGYYCVVLE